MDRDSTGGSIPRTTDSRPWLCGAALTGRSEHSSPRLRTGRSVVRGKGPIPSTKGLDAGDRRQLVINFANTWDLGKGAFTRPTFVFVNDDA